MRESLGKLISIAGPEISPAIGVKPRLSHGRLGEELATFLTHKNGFYAFESALHVFPLETSGNALGLRQWNEDALWRSGYGGLAAGFLFFAEDVFGRQFAIGDEAIYSFDAE